MDWKVFVALALLGVAILLGLVIALYSSVSRYAKQFDPAQHPPGDTPGEGDRRP